VTDLTGKQIINEVRQKAIRERLTTVLQTVEPADQVTAKV
jgi:hypothetical protein